MDLFFRLNPVALLLLIPGLISAALAVYAFNVRRVAGSRVFACVMLAVSLWSLGYGAELTGLNLESIMLMIDVEYLGIATLPVLWLVLTLIYTGRRQWVRLPYLVGLFAIPFITLVLVSTSQFHPIYYSSISLDTSGPLTQLSITRGIWYWINSGYSYLVILFSTGLLFEKLRHPHTAYRPQIIALLGGVTIPWTVNILYLADSLVIFGHLDPTPFAFAASGLVITLGIFRYRLFSVIPVARDQLIESMKEGVIVVDSENKLGDMNLAARYIFGWVDGDLGKPIDSLLTDWPDIVIQYRSPGNSRQEVIQGSGPEKRNFEVTVTRLLDRAGSLLGRLTVVKDITEFKILEYKLEEMATHDPLTSLPGRVLLTDRVGMAVARARRQNSKLALMMLDLDRFKSVNDSLGHSAGDKLLQSVSGRLLETLRKQDTLARLGGDEFVVLLPDIDGSKDARAAAIRLILSFQEPFKIEGHVLQVSLSLGIAFFPEDGEDFEQLLKQADDAMYLAKKNGRNRYELARQGSSSASVYSNAP